MTEWDESKKYLIFYAKDDSIIKRRDIRNQLKDAVETGDKLQQRITRLTKDCSHLATLGFNDLHKRVEADKKLEAIRGLLPLFDDEAEKNDEAEQPILWLKRKILEVLEPSIDSDKLGSEVE